MKILFAIEKLSYYLQGGLVLKVVRAQTFINDVLKKRKKERRRTHGGGEDGERLEIGEEKLKKDLVYTERREKKLAASWHCGCCTNEDILFVPEASTIPK